MKKQILLIAFTVLLNSGLISQIVFEKGYFINEENERIECLLKNRDWSNNPSGFEYKISEEGEGNRLQIEQVREFGIDNGPKYIRASVMLDRSDDLVDGLTKVRDPILNEEQVFLKVLVEGRGSLYIYKDGNLVRFFYKMKNIQIDPLIHKKYIVKDNVIAENNDYKYQLFSDSECSDITVTEINNVRYVRNDLVKFFIKYNECLESEYLVYNKKQERDFFSIGIRPGLNISRLDLQATDIEDEPIRFDPELNLRIGFETEFILPVNKDKWSVTIEYAYQQYNSYNEDLNSTVFGGVRKTNVEYKSIQMPVGIRHYFFLNNESKVYLSASYVFDYEFNSFVEIKRFDDSIMSIKDIKTRNSAGIAAGYKFKDKYFLEISWQTAREILSDPVNRDSGFRTLGILLGYSFR